MADKKLKYYYVGCAFSWYVVKGYNKKEVARWAKISEGPFNEIRIATDSEVQYYRKLKGEIEVCDA